MTVHSTVTVSTTSVKLGAGIHSLVTFCDNMNPSLGAEYAGDAGGERSCNFVHSSRYILFPMCHKWKAALLMKIHKIIEETSAAEVELDKPKT